MPETMAPVDAAWLRMEDPADPMTVVAALWFAVSPLGQRSPRALMSAWSDDFPGFASAPSNVCLAHLGGRTIHCFRCTRMCVASPCRLLTTPVRFSG